MYIICWRSFQTDNIRLLQTWCMSIFLDSWHTIPYFNGVLMGFGPARIEAASPHILSLPILWHNLWLLLHDFFPKISTGNLGESCSYFKGWKLDDLNCTEQELSETKRSDNHSDPIFWEKTQIASHVLLKIDEHCLSLFLDDRNL